MLSDAAYAKQIKAAFEFAQCQVRALIKKHPDYSPMYTVNGKWKHEGEKWTHWCDGFLPGQMWIFYQHTGDRFWRQKAVHYSKPLEPRQHDRNVHDLGFIFCSTYRLWLDAIPATGKKGREVGTHLEDVLVQAGTTMGLRFKEKGQYLRSFVEDASLFVDIMMNVGIIFYAAQKQADAEAYQIQQRAVAQKGSVDLLLGALSQHPEIASKYLDYLMTQELKSNSKWVIGQPGVVLQVPSETPVP